MKQKSTHTFLPRAGALSLLGLSLTTCLLFNALQPAFAALLTGHYEPLADGANVNLTAEGTLDWVHWGYLWEQQIDRKYGAPQQINYTPVIDTQWDGPYWIGASVHRFSWSDGAPILSVPETHTGVFFIGLNHGFQITCPADTSLKRLKLYVGVNYAGATLTATLSGGEVPGYTNSALVSPFNGSNAVFTVDFQGSAPGQTLTVNCTISESLGSGNGINLFATTLASDLLPPTVEIVSPPNRTVLTAPATVSITATSTVASGSVTNLEIFRDATRVGQTNGNALSLTLSNLATNTYIFTARATDNRGLAVTSMPVTVYVITGGGYLQGSLVSPPATNVNLTTEGTVDWAHWGLTTASSFDHKTAVSQVIPNVAPVGVNANKIDRYADNLTGYTWTDGTPTVAATNTPTGVLVSGLNNGFELTLPASPTLRRVKIYVGLYGAQGKFEASLSDGSGPPYISTSLRRAYDNAYAVYTLTYASRSASANLVIRWTANFLYDELYGNVTWQAATMAMPPSLSCAPSLIVNCDTVWDFTPPTASGFCEDNNVTIAILSTMTNVLCGHSYAATRTWQATDPCGNSATCSQTITVADTNAPVITCAPNLTVEVGTPWEFTPPSATDTCNSDTLTITLVGTVTNATCGNAYIATRTWRATDACGNSASCSQSVLAQDSTPPVISCAASLTNEWDTVWDFTPPTATDTGSGANVTITTLNTVTNFACANAFRATRIWQATDACGNYSTCSQSVTVLDTLPPEITCGSEMTVEAGSDWDFTPPTVMDAAAGTNVSVTVLTTITNAVCGESFVVTRTWQATDPCGNAAYCSQTLHVMDTSPPRLELISPLAPGSFGFTFCTLPGRNYIVLHSGSLTSTNWQVATNMAGTGGQIRILQSGGLTGQRFYRLQVE